MPSIVVSCWAPHFEWTLCFASWCFSPHKAVAQTSSSVQSFSRVWLFATPWTAACQASLFFTSSRDCSNSCPSNWWCHPTISFSVIPFTSCLQSFPESGSFQMSQLFISGGQRIEVSASASILPMNVQDWFPLGWTGLIFFQSKGLSRTFFYTTVQKHQFFGAHLSFFLLSNLLLRHPRLSRKPQNNIRSKLALALWQYPLGCMLNCFSLSNSAWPYRL